MIFYFDKTNRLSEIPYKRRSIPIDQFFDEMEISEDSKEHRKQMATALYDAVAFLFILLPMYAEAGYIDEQMLIYQFAQKYREAIEDKLVIDDVVERRITKASAEVVQTTLEHFVKDNENYFTSDDRAMLIATNEANLLANYEDFDMATMMGYDQKTWITMQDSKVRKSHQEIDRTTIPIDEYFEVDGDLMLYPMDESNGASPGNIINCRCAIEYSKSNEE